MTTNTQIPKNTGIAQHGKYFGLEVSPCETQQRDRIIVDTVGNRLKLVRFGNTPIPNRPRHLEMCYLNPNDKTIVPFFCESLGQWDLAPLELKAKTPDFKSYNKTKITIIFKVYVESEENQLTVLDTFEFGGLLAVSHAKMMTAARNRNRGDPRVEKARENKRRKIEENNQRIERNKRCAHLVGGGLADEGLLSSPFFSSQIEQNKATS